MATEEENITTDETSEEESTDNTEEESQDEEESTQDESEDQSGNDDDEGEDSDDDFEPETRTTSKKEDQEEKDDEEDLIDDEDEKAISKVVEKQLKDVREKLTQVERLRDEAEVNNFIQTNPDYGKYKNSALKYMAHDAYKNIPVGNIMAMLSAKDAQKIGAKKEREASAKSKQTQSKGNTSRKVETGKTDYSTMSKEEFDKVKQNVLQGSR